jgi:polyhydroxybutyrate depolymerase
MIVGEETMALYRILLLVILCATLAACSDDASAPQSGQSTQRALMVGDDERTFRLFVPVAADTGSSPLPLMLIFHGTNDTGRDMEVTTGMNTFADAAGYFVAYPNSMASDWAEGCGCSQADLAMVNDTGFVRAVVQMVSDDYSVDPDAVYAAGFSQGGMFTYHLACEMTDLFAGVASVAAAMGVPVSQACAPSLPLAVLGIQGTEDNTFDYDGGGVDEFAWLGATATIDTWSVWNGCEDTPTVTHPPPVANDSTSLVVRRYLQCDASSETSAIGVTGGEHEWWMSAEFNTTLTVADFFLDHPRVP